nr:Fic family protein [Acidobacteriota bacterium]
MAERGETGRYEPTTVGGERVRAFVPAPLPPDPPVDLRGELQQLLEAAVLAVGRLDGASALLPDASLFLYSYVRKEAVLSSQIEGTHSNYVAALDHGLARLRAGFPLSNRLIREAHGVLLSRGRGSGGAPGEFRRSQNWI